MISSLFPLHSSLKNDTICALATSPGGAIGIIRLSGPLAFTIADSVFKPTGGKTLSQAKANTIHYGEIQDNEGHIVDDVLVSVFRAPHSYTGEDSIEISCHGSRYVLQQVLQLLITNGARQAEPGEYTKRAYINGKMDLSQAEAVADLIASTNRATHQIAISQLRGRFSSLLANLRDQLLKLTSLLELELDFSDHEELEFADRSELRSLAEEIDAHILRLAHSFETGQALKKGIPVAIIGKTNVGKSTLLNQLVGEERAIVSDVHGTTRDVIEDTIDIQGVTFRFIDTAGLRKTSDTVEQIGIERTYQKLSEATIVLWLTDKNPTDEERLKMTQRCEGKKMIEVRNKVDDINEVRKVKGEEGLKISAKSGLGLDSLCHALVKTADIPSITENDVIVTSARHYDSLQRAHSDLERILEAMDFGLSGDLIAEDLREALHHLAEITGGEIVTDEVLGNIFQHFCVGK